MKSFWKEYGLIAVLIVVAVGGYLLVDRNREELLAFSLDAIGSRLVALVDDNVSKQRIARAFDAFKQRVANDEVTSDQVELVAANILNLSTSGARISPEDAEFILNLNEEALLADLPVPALPAERTSATAGADRRPGPDAAPRPVRPGESTGRPALEANTSAAAPAPPGIDARALATRIEAMVGVAESFHRTPPPDSVMGRFRLFSPSSGLHIEIDPRTGRHDVRVDLEAVQATARAFERSGAPRGDESMAGVGDLMAEEQDAWARFMERQHQDIERFQRDLEIRSVELEAAVDRLERLTRLQDHGLYAPFDTVKFGARMDELMKRLREKAGMDNSAETPPTDSDLR